MNEIIDFNFKTNELSKVEFMKKVYGHVALAVLAFVVFEYYLLHSSIGYQLGSLLMGTPILFIAIMIGGSWVAQMWAYKPGNLQRQYMGLFLFALVEAIIFLPMFFYLFESEALRGQATEILGQSAIVTGGMFTGLSAVALFSNTDFSFLRTALTVGFGVAFAAVIAGWIFGFDLGLGFSVIVILLASGAILYNTQRIMYEYQSDQYVAGALRLFSSLMLLFYYVLRIFMSSRD